ncbi:heme lyase CcmF/NrfE family subunit [Thiobacillus sp. 0-1251]|uniref:heme lyase CcmF/NrfE family subunit n=1 Tax=Thiobacillus sp. 0-1251 TaxID=1895858 RepID=UPI000963E8D1|nr:heme lyase CcmF/NrfE family subunit [Thiobacillus sp. 0-1251]OJY55191.1 MAG: c-type cytochrome biogenesis protein CcmF [Thiobacillus sp. 0-1251]
MIPEIGHFALIVAFLISLALAVFPIVGAQRGIASWMAMARPAAQGLFVFIMLAMVCLAYSFAVNDFSVLYVASNSNSMLPLHYRLAAVWGGHEGSVLLWVFMLTFWMVAVSLFSRHLPREMVARILGVMGFICVGFLLFILLTSNPFERLLPAALDGRDLNPLLQDPGMIFHPPMLYMGYVGFSVAFAFAIAALLGGNLDAAWARWSRPWTLVAWVFLTVGIALGSAWAYYELGWGGWWFWDPVENASFMPWLVGTALIHSLAVTEKRGSFKNWTVLLAIFAFSLSLLGTFLVRSGVLTSVHAFATDPRRGIFILIFLAVVTGGSLLLFAWRAAKVGLGGRFDLVSRESMLLANNVILVVAAGSVLLGTLYPLVLDALRLGKISVGPPYFDTVFAPLMAPAIFLMGVGPFARWKSASLPDLAVRLRWAFGISLVSALLLPVVLGHWSPMISFGLLLALWVFATTTLNLWNRVRPTMGASVPQRLGNQSRSYYGMLLAHLGVGVFIVGVTLVKGYQVEKDVRMEVGDTATIGAYQFVFKGVTETPGPNYMASRGAIDILKNGRLERTLAPEKRMYFATQMPMTEAAIDPGLIRDLYVSLGEPVGKGAWVVRVYYKPFVDWIWGGCLVMALGGAMALSDRRYRMARRREPAALAGRLAEAA